MSLRDDLNACTPSLRRYARALATGQPGGSALADDLVQAALVRALGARQIGSSGELAVRLYATVTQLHRDLLVAGRQARAAGAGRPTLVSSAPAPDLVRRTRLSAGLMSLSLEEREALLLVSLEGFDYADAARILRVSQPVLLARLTDARQRLDTALKTPRPHQPSTPQALAPRRGRDVPYLRLVN